MTKKKASIEDVLEALKKLTAALAAPKTTEPASAPPPPASIKMEHGFPIPYEYQELVKTMLNKEFAVDIKYLPDAASFEFSILVPKKYSNAPENHWLTYNEDRRTKVIQNAYGANGVREWVLQIYENFPQTTQSLITYDRAQL